MLDNLHYLLRDIYEVTRDFPGGLEIMHGMQAMAPLQGVRLESQWAVAESFGRIWCDRFRMPFTPDILRRARIAVGLCFLVVQMALEDNRLDPDEALREGADAVAAYLRFSAEQSSH